MTFDPTHLANLQAANQQRLADLAAQNVQIGQPAFTASIQTWFIDWLLTTQIPEAERQEVIDSWRVYAEEQTATWLDAIAADVRRQRILNLQLPPHMNGGRG